MSKVKDIRAFVRAWATRRHLPKDLFEDAVQEAWVAALESDYERKPILQALDTFRDDERRQPTPFSQLEDNEAVEIENGLCFDAYHGVCKDDV